MIYVQVNLSIAKSVFCLRILPECHFLCVKMYECYVHPQSGLFLQRDFIAEQFSGSRQKVLVPPHFWRC